MHEQGDVPMQGVPAHLLLLSWASVPARNSRTSKLAIHIVRRAGIHTPSAGA